MATTLYDKLWQLVQSERASREDVRSALLEKGVIAPASFTVADIADLIRLIFQSDFEFFFNFKNIDQFGSPHKLSVGWQSNGLTLYNPNLDDITIPDIFVFGNSDEHNAKLTLCPARAFGLWIGSDNYNQLVSEQDNATAKFISEFPRFDEDSFNPTMS